MNPLLTALLLAPLFQPATGDTQSPFLDVSRGIEVRYAFTSAGVEFSADLPAGWAFSVAIDGDRNGAWGNGPGLEAARRGPTADRKFGLDIDDRSLCAQSVLASMPDQPDLVYASTDCGGYRSAGRAEIGGLSAAGRERITLVIPLAEVFDGHRDARLQVCVWDTQMMACQHSPSHPYLLPNPAAQSSTI